MPIIAKLSQEPTTQIEAKEFSYVHPTLGVTCRFLNGDSFEFMENCPPGIYDAIVTDIPYNVRNDPNAEFDKDPFDIERFVPLARRVLAKHGVLITFCSSLELERLERLLAPHFDGGVRDGVWAKFNPMPWHKGVTNDKENFVVAWPKERADIHTTLGAPWNIVTSPITHCNELVKKDDSGKPKNTLHATQKPVEMLTRLLRRFVPEGSHVFDPCAGTFAVGKACVLSGRNYTGIELNKFYFQRGTEMFHDEEHMGICAEGVKRAETSHGDYLLQEIEKHVTKKAGMSDQQWKALRKVIETCRGFPFMVHTGHTHASSLGTLIAMVLVLGLILLLVLKA